ncbi:MAG TPA: DinB family protein [Candidatus Sulfotelmatobacter sp.]|jgi:uncharacterized damage-inducible protein DinB
MLSHESSLHHTSTKQLFASDLHYSSWATRRLLEACAALSAEELERDLRLSHKNILSTLQHICDGERIWLDCLSTTAAGGNWTLPPDPAPKLTLNDLAQKWPDLWQGYEKWLVELPDAASELEAEVFVKIPDGRVPRFTRWHILRHVLDHSQFHRGQLIGMIRNLGHRLQQSIAEITGWSTELANDPSSKVVPQTKANLEQSNFQ